MAEQSLNITVYTRMLCPFCFRAVKLLKSKNVTFDEIDAGFNPKKRTEMLQRSNGKSTYPQIFIGDYHVGGFDDMAELDRNGELDKLLLGVGR